MPWEEHDMSCFILCDDPSVAQHHRPVQAFYPPQCCFQLEDFSHVGSVNDKLPIATILTHSRWMITPFTTNCVEEISYNRLPGTGEIRPIDTAYNLAIPAAMTFAYKSDSAHPK